MQERRITRDIEKNTTMRRICSYIKEMKNYK